MATHAKADYFNAVYMSRHGATKKARTGALVKLFEIACKEDRPTIRDAARKRLREEGIVVRSANK